MALNRYVRRRVGRSVYLLRSRALESDPEARALARFAAERATASRDTHQRAFE